LAFETGYYNDLTNLFEPETAFVREEIISTGYL